METINLGRVAFAYKGDYSALTTYNKMDVVFDGESSFVSQIDNNVGNELVNGLNWKYLSRGNHLELQEAKQDIAALETNLNTSCGMELIPMYKENGYIDTNKAIGETVDLTYVTSSSYNVYVANCTEGDYINITGVGFWVQRLWCIVDGANKVLMVSNELAVANNLVIQIPSGGAKIIINDKKSGGLSYIYRKGNIFWSENNTKKNKELIETNKTKIDIIKGKNIAPLGVSYSQNGISITVNSNGSYIFNGSLSEGVSEMIYSIYDSRSFNEIVKNVDYYSKFNYIEGAQVIIQSLDGLNYSVDSFYSALEDEEMYFKFSDNTVGYRIRIRFNRFFNGVNELFNFSVHEKNSFETVFSELKKEVVPVVSPSPMVTFIDDDGFQKFKTLLLPIILTKNVPITSSVVGKDVESGDPKFMSWTDIKECYENGADIISHTYINLSESASANLTTREIQYDYQKMQNKLFSHGINNTGLVFVGGSSSVQKCVDAAKLVYDYGFSAGYPSNINYKGTINKYGIRRYNFDEVYGTYTNLINEIVTNNTGWLVFMLHTSSGTFQQPEADKVAEMIDYCISNGVSVVTTSTGYKNYVE